MPLTVAVFLVVGSFGASALFIPKNGSFSRSFALSLISSAYGAQSAQAANDFTAAGTAPGQDASSLSQENYGAEYGYLATEEGAAFDSTQGSVKDPGGAFAEVTSQSGVINYTIRQGDTLPSIAAYFGITVDTITSANPKFDPANVHPGTVLKILPVSGVLYTTRAGDTLASVAAAFNVAETQIVQANPSVDLASASGPVLTFLNSGISLIIPTGK